MISIEGMVFYAFHGCTEDEKKVGIYFEVDVHIRCDLSTPATTDRISDALNYQSVYTIVAKEMQQTSHLIEHVGKRIKDAILSKFSAAEDVNVKISKMNPPLGGKVKKVSIII